MFSFVGPCNSQDDFHHRGHIGHHSIFLFGGTGMSSGHLRISRISVRYGNNFWCAHMFGSLHIEKYSFSVWAVRIYFALLYLFYEERPQSEFPTRPTASKPYIARSNCTYVIEQ
jgi:hypothetical protein